MIKNHLEYSKIINSISAIRDWYNDAVTWGETWLREHGLLEQQEVGILAFNDLIAMKKSSKKPQEGDVFVLQPVIGKFYFGKVVQTNLKSIDSFINGMTLIYIYKCCSIEKQIPLGLETEELLIAPIIVNNQPWLKGYFETIGNKPVLENEKTVDFAFWDTLKKEYVDINGQVIKN